MRSSSDPKPSGWDVNPSALGQRATCVIIGLVGLASAIACTLHASGVTATLWEPLPVVTDDGLILPAVAAFHPILDVIGLALVVFALLVGSERRWLTRPAMVFATGALALATAASAVARWSWQYFTRDTTSTLFFVTAACAVAILPLVADEVYAAAFARARAQTSRGVPHSGESWPGYLAGAGGVALGLYLLAAPSIGHGGFRHGHLLGGLIAAVGAISLSQAARPARWINAALGAWLVVAPLVLGFQLRGLLHLLVAGLLLMTCSIALSPSTTLRERGLRHVG
jgi:hypothetical protein